MKCYHFLTPPIQTSVRQYRYLTIGSQWLLVHDDADGCDLPGSCGHLLLQDPIPSAFATALASYNVLPTDTVAQMAIKMGKVFRPFHP